MSMQDPIADMFVRIRNAHASSKKEVFVPLSGIKKEVCRILKDEGYIIDYRIGELLEQSSKPPPKGTNSIIRKISTVHNHDGLIIQLKYHQTQPVIEMLKRVSRVGLRLYCKHKDLPSINDHLGIVIITTSKGVMTGKQAKAAGLGGEILCAVF